MELTRLRKATESQHRKVERDLDLLRASFGRDQYLVLLRRFYGFHQAWEPKVEARLESELPGFFAPRRKLHNIEADLRYLGAGTQDLVRVPKCEKLPSMESVGLALGSMYVIEGSSLGGRILARHFGERLGMLPDAGCKFFAGYSERTSQMWSDFAEIMANRPAAEDDDMLEAAVSTFEVVGEWLGTK